MFSKHKEMDSTLSDTTSHKWVPMNVVVDCSYRNFIGSQVKAVNILVLFCCLARYQIQRAPGPRN